MMIKDEVCENINYLIDSHIFPRICILLGCVH